MSRVKWLDPNRQHDLSSITEFGCHYAGTVEQLQLETRSGASGPAQRLAANAKGAVRLAQFAPSRTKHRQKPEWESVMKIEPKDAARIFSEIASFLVSRVSAHTVQGEGFWDILLVDGNGRAFTGSGAFGSDSASLRVSAAIRQILGTDFDLFDGGCRDTSGEPETVEKAR